MSRLVVEQVPLGDLRPYPGNARRGDVDAIASSLETNGQFRPLVVQTSTGYVLGGNHTLQAMQRLGWPSCQVTRIDVDDAAARRIVLADNRTADLGGYDERALLSLLREVGDDMEGTGYDLDDFDSLLASLQEADAENPPQEPTVLIPGQAPTPAPRPAPTYPEFREEYSSQTTRFLPLNYPLPQYTWLMERLTSLAEVEGVEGPAEAVLRLVEMHTGDDAPAAELQEATSS